MPAAPIGPWLGHGEETIDRGQVLQERPDRLDHTEVLVEDVHHSSTPFGGKAG
jgi:hypothetical protein